MDGVSSGMDSKDPTGLPDRLGMASTGLRSSSTSLCAAALYGLLLPSNCCGDAEDATPSSCNSSTIRGSATPILIPSFIWLPGACVC